MRICSLVPGATEVVAALGLTDQLVGISHECDFPPQLGEIPVMVRARVDSRSRSSAEIDAQVGTFLSAGESLYELDEPGLLAAKPDVVITQDLCDVCALTPAQLAAVLRKLVPPPRIVTLTPRRLDDILRDTVTLGIALGKPEAGALLAAQLRGRLDAVRHLVSAESARPRVACLEWLSPFYTAGHWVPDMVEAAGGIDALAHAGAASHTIDWDRLAAAAPDIIMGIDHELRDLVQRPGWDALRAVRQHRLCGFAITQHDILVRPGPRMGEAAAALADCLVGLAASTAP